jgi:hypothetical protein
MERDPLDVPDAEWCQSVLVLQASKLALDGGAATVEAFFGVSP